MIPLWLTTLAWISLILGVASSLVVSLDLRRHPQPMSIMNVVWPLCALAGHVLVLYFYWRCARTTHAEAHHAHHHSSQPMAVKIGKSTLHCGAGCTAGILSPKPWLGFSLLSRSFSVGIFSFKTRYLPSGFWISSWHWLSAFYSNTWRSNR